MEERLGIRLPHVGASSIPTEEMRGNVENPIGAAQVPLGIAGPLLVHGEHAKGTFFVPLATTEGALVRSYERGMVALTRAGGVTARLHGDVNQVSPIFVFDEVAAAEEFARSLPGELAAVRAEAESTTRHGKLQGLDAFVVGRNVIVNFRYHTADAQGMNMIVKATDRACRALRARSRARRHYIFSGLCSEKRPSGFLLTGSKGKKVSAGALVPRAVVEFYLRATPEQLADVWQRSVVGHLKAGSLGFSAQYANGLAALFIACGQDVANVANAAVGVTAFELTEERDLYASVTLDSLTVATVGGGTGLPTARECLAILGCAGRGGAPKLAEIVAASLLAGELSMAAAIASGEFVEAHERYGRNRPPEPGS